MRLEEAMALPIGALVHVECNSGCFCTEHDNCGFSGKVGTLARINEHNTDGDFFGVSFPGNPHIVYFWAHELHVMALAGADHHQGEMMPCGFAFIAHLLALALVYLEVEALGPIVAEGEFELEVDGWLATVELHGKRVCLWDLHQDGDWEVYSMLDLSAATGELVEDDEDVHRERMRIYWTAEVWQ